MYDVLFVSNKRVQYYDYAFAVITCFVPKQNVSKTLTQPSLDHDILSVHSLVKRLESQM